MSSAYTPIDVSKSLVPVNPETISEHLMYDPRSGSSPIPYVGKNILPTELGYMSFFGTGNTIGASLLNKDIQEILSYRTLHGDTILIALCRDGCYFRALAGDGTPTLTNIPIAGSEPEKIQVDLASFELASWTFLFNSPQGSTSPWHLWTWAILENELYLYQKGMKYIARLASTQKGQFFVEKLLPAYIINGSNKIYKYVTSLTVNQISAFSSRQITHKGITLSTDTSSPITASLAHSNLVAKMLGAGVGAILRNYEILYSKFDILDINYIGTVQDPFTTNSSATTFSDDGSKVYYSCNLSDGIVYIKSAELSTLWDISTAGPYTQVNLDTVVGVGLTTCLNLQFNPTGTKLFAALYYDSGTSWRLTQFTLTTAWDITTLQHAGVTFTGASSGPTVVSPSHVEFKSDGSSFFCSYNSNPSSFDIDSIREFILPTPWDISTVDTTPTGKLIATARPSGYEGRFRFSSDGKKLFLITSSSGTGTQKKIYQNTLSAAWDVTTASAAGSADFSSVITYQSYNFIFNKNGDHLYITGSIGSAPGNPWKFHYAGDLIGYKGDIEFSIAALDGVDPAVSVGATSADEPFTITSATNEVIELAQVEGIATSRGRLIAWDYTNTLYLGSAQNPIDFTPSITTQANVFRVDAIKGNIVLILPHPEGAVIYSTGNIVKSTYQGTSGQQIFSYRAMREQGVIDPRHIAKGSNEHYLIGSIGLYKVNYAENRVELIAKELVDFLKRYQYPTQIQILGTRYLAISLIESPLAISMRKVRDGVATSFETGQDAAGQVRPVQVLNSLVDVPFGQNLFPTFKEVLIYDTVLEKWGYGSLDFKTLLSINPVNQEGYPAEKDYALREASFFNDVRSLAGLLSSGSLVLFNDAPSDAWVVYGKYMVSRSHLTKVLRVDASFVDYPEAKIQLEPSLDGRTIQASGIRESAVFTKSSFVWPILSVAKWFNLVIRGRFNLASLGIEGKKDGKRS